MNKTLRDTIAPVALLAALCAAPAASAAEHSPTPVEVSVPFPPTPAVIGGATRLFYEFHLISHGRKAGLIDEVEILDSDTGATLGDDKGDALKGLIQHPGATEDAAADPRELGPGAAAVVFMETTLPAGAAPPKRLRWRLHFSAPAAGVPVLPPVEGDIAVDQRPPVAIGFPLPAGRWVASNGPSNTSGHRRSLQVVDGRARISQRFAIDWIELAPDGHAFHGDPKINKNWVDFGTGVLAVADATVSATHDGIPENEPTDKRAVPITLETIGGNYVILDLGDGRYAFYAHLQPGSLRVHVGDKVRRGQVLGLLGNTGNSDAPHLHFHVSDTNNPLGAEGVPYVYPPFASPGGETVDLAMSGKPWTPAPGAQPVRRVGAMPAENEVVDIK